MSKETPGSAIHYENYKTEAEITRFSIISKVAPSGGNFATSHFFKKSGHVNVEFNVTT